MRKFQNTVAISKYNFQRLPLWLAEKSLWYHLWLAEKFPVGTTNRHCVKYVSSADNYMFKINNRNTRTRCEMFKVNFKDATVSIVNFQQTNAGCENTNFLSTVFWYILRIAKNTTFTKSMSTLVKEIMILQAFQEVIYMKLVWMILFPTEMTLSVQKYNSQHSCVSIYVYTVSSWASANKSVKFWFLVIFQWGRFFF